LHTKNQVHETKDIIPDFAYPALSDTGTKQQPSKSGSQPELGKIPV
jgi:hypothetical protein